MITAVPRSLLARKGSQIGREHSLGEGGWGGGGWVKKKYWCWCCWCWCFFSSCCLLSSTARPDPGSASWSWPGWWCTTCPAWTPGRRSSPRWWRPPRPDPRCAGRGTGVFFFRGWGVGGERGREGGREKQLWARVVIYLLFVFIFWEKTYCVMATTREAMVWWY